MLKIFRKDKSVELPKYENMGDSGLDLRSAEEVKITPLSRAVVPTGLVKLRNVVAEVGVRLTNLLGSNEGLARITSGVALQMLII